MAEAKAQKKTKSSNGIYNNIAKIRDFQVFKNTKYWTGGENGETMEWQQCKPYKYAKHQENNQMVKALWGIMVRIYNNIATIKISKY